MADGKPLCPGDTRGGTVHCHRIGEADFQAAQQKGDESAAAALELRIDGAVKSIALLQEEVVATQALFDRIAERYRLAADRESLDTAKQGESGGGGSGESVPIGVAMQQKRALDVAQQEVDLARRRFEALQNELEIFHRSRERARRALDKVNTELDSGTQLSKERTRSLLVERQNLLDEERSIDARIEDLRQRLLHAEAQVRIEEDEAQGLAVQYGDWRRRLWRSIGLLVLAVMVLSLARIIVSRKVKDPERRYYLNRNLAYLTFFVVLLGLLFIFVRQFSQLLTGIGVVLAGLTIALQETVQSFFGWFAIHGNKGYRVGDWIRVGDQYGEVVDIGLTVTVLDEVTPFEPGGRAGGGKTGTLTTIPNNSLFKLPLTNYTRGYPYIWCALPYTLTYESNCQRGEELVNEILVGNKEVVTTAKQARKKLEGMAADFAIKVDNTAPAIRTWAGSSGVELRVRFLAHPRRRVALIDRVNRDIMAAFANEDTVEFAYSTMRIIPTPGLAPPP